MPLRASSVSALDAMARVFARRAFRDAAETAGAAWTLETRDGVSRAKDLESALERRGESWRRRNARLALAASEAVRADVVAFAEAETESFARSPIALPDALRNDTRALVAKSLETFDLWTSGFEDLPERARARASLAATLGDLAAAARDANAASWAEALAPVGAAARDRLEAEPTCFRRGAGNARSLASLASRLRACARDASPSVVERRAAEAWLAAFEDAKDARTFFGKRKFLSSSASDAGAGAGAARQAGCPPTRFAKSRARSPRPTVASLRFATRRARDAGASFFFFSPRRFFSPPPPLFLSSSRRRDRFSSRGGTLPAATGDAGRGRRRSRSAGDISPTRRRETETIGGARKRTRTRSRSPRVSRFRTPPPPPPRRPSP